MVGEHTGFNCVEASLASGEINVVLVPEIAFELQGSKGVLKYVYDYVMRNRYIVIVVAEGAHKSAMDCNLD